MHRNIKVLTISAINGFCLFMLCTRICRLGKTEFLSPSHSLSIALVLKIFCNLISDRGRLAIDFLWNTSLLIIYSIFTYVVDHHEVIKRYKTIYPTPSFFRTNASIIKHTEYPWTDYRFIVTTILLILVLYSPFAFKGRTPPQPVKEELINKYRLLLKLKQLKKLSQHTSDQASSECVKESIKEEAIEPTKEKTASPRKSQSQCKQNLKSVDGRDNKSQVVLSTLSSTSATSSTFHKLEVKHVGDAAKMETVDQKASAHWRNGTGDRTFASPMIHPVDLCTINTQTDLKMSLPGRSTAIQCTKLNIPWKIAKSVISRKTGSSTTYLVTRTDKSTNTLQAKYRTKTKSTSPQYSLNSKSKSRTVARDPFKLGPYSMHVRKYMRKQVNQPPNGAANYYKLGYDPVNMAQQPACFPVQKPRSQVFNLEDLMHAKYGTPLHDGVIGLDMFPTRDYPQKHKDPLEMLYHDHSNSKYDDKCTRNARYDYYNERRRY